MMNNFVLHPSSKSWPAVGLVVLCAAVVLGWSRDVRGEVYHRPPFHYYYQGKDVELLERLDRDLRRKLSEIESALGTDLTSPVRVDLTLTREEFNRLTRGRVPHWAGGVAYPERWRVVIKAPLFFGQGVPLKVLAAHEVAHLLIHKAAGYNHLPRWMDEGLAQVLAGESRHGSLRRISRAAAGDRLMGLPRVDMVLGFSAPEADLAYAEARSAVARLVNQFGWEGVRRILTGVRQDLEFSDAFHKATGVEYEAWQVEWIEYASAHYRWVALLEIDNLIWIFIVLLAATAVTAAYIRRRRQFRRWREEEESDLNEHSEPINP